MSDITTRVHFIIHLHPVQVRACARSSLVGSSWRQMGQLLCCASQGLRQGGWNACAALHGITCTLWPTASSSLRAPPTAQLFSEHQMCTCITRETLRAALRLCHSASSSRPALPCTAKHMMFGHAMLSLKPELKCKTSICMPRKCGILQLYTPVHRCQGLKRVGTPRPHKLRHCKPA